MSNHKLGIIAPYRDRYDQLMIFKRHITKFLKKTDIDYELIIVEQDNAKNFNRGKLLNIGFLVAKKLGCDYVVFHDIDMIPTKVDYSYSDHPTHLASKFVSENKNFKRIIFDEYFGGVTIFPVDDFERINGYSNEYWGWGYEDDDLLWRCKVNGIKLDKKEIQTTGGNSVALKFNGHNAFVEGRNTFNLSQPITLFISFCSDDVYCNFEKYDDTYSIFSIPGLDMNINFNSYSRYNFEIYDENENITYINSELKPNYETTICVTINPITKTIKMFQDGIIVGEKTYTGNLYNYESVRKFYLGVGDVRRKDEPKYFRGLIDRFAVFNDELSEIEIQTISKNKHYGLTQNFDYYTSSDKLHLSYDCKFIKGYKLIDLSGNENHGKISNCEIVKYDFKETKLTHIPFRRQCTFRLLTHEENGYVNGAWKDLTTRYNQMRYYNEVVRGFRDEKEDGLSNCKYKEVTQVKIDNQTHVTVSI